eukprot:8492235-Pyramimonas_sp.AAC.1
MEVFERVRHARGADASKWPAWSYLTRIVLLPGTRARAFDQARRAVREARLAEFDEHVDTRMVLKQWQVLAR